MGKHLAAILVAMAWLTGACADTTGPPGPARPTWELSSPSRDSDVERHMLRQSAAAPALETYEVWFQAARGRRTSVQIDYQTIGGSRNAERFLQLDFPADALLRRPDGTPFQDGDGVTITVSVDPTRFLVNLEPSGLVFDPDAPVRLQIWYNRADGDLNRDGRVDAADAATQRDRLGIWYRDSPGTPWSRWAAAHFSSEKRFRTDLVHFSGYAVSW